MGESWDTIEAEAFHRRYHPRRIARRTIACELTIRAPAEVIWTHLTAFDRYGSWNPFLPRARGHLEVGTPIDLEVALLRSKPFPQREWINLVRPYEALCWGTHMFHPVLLTTNRWQTIRPVDAAADTAVYTNRLELSGLLAPVVMHYYGKRLDRSFRLAARALQSLCES